LATALAAIACLPASEKFDQIPGLPPSLYWVELPYYFHDVVADFEHPWRWRAREDLSRTLFRIERMDSN
jgi:hypothetical protein